MPWQKSTNTPTYLKRAIATRKLGTAQRATKTLQELYWRLDVGEIIQRSRKRLEKPKLNFQQTWKWSGSLQPISWGITAHASAATAIFPTYYLIMRNNFWSMWIEFITIQKVARTERADPLLLLGWNSPKYVHTTGILPPTLQFCIKYFKR